MTELEFQKMNERLLRMRQIKQISSEQHYGQTQTCDSEQSKMDTAAGNFKPEPIECAGGCGVMVEPVLFECPDFKIKRWQKNYICQDCCEKIKAKEQAAKEKTRLQNIRRQRILKQQRLITQLADIPALYSKARLMHLKTGFKNLLLGDDSIFLWGGVGVGKTYSAAALMRQKIANGGYCKRVVFENLLAQIRGFDQAEEDILRPYLKCNLLILEDLGISKTDFSSRILFRIVDERLEAMKKTVITSNEPIEKIGQIYGERIFSRLQTYKIAKLSGKDRRLNK